MWHMYNRQFLGHAFPLVNFPEHYNHLDFAIPYDIPGQRKKERRSS